MEGIMWLIKNFLDCQAGESIDSSGFGLFPFWIYELPLFDVCRLVLGLHNCIHF